MNAMHSIKFILYYILWICFSLVASFAINEILHPSKNPVFFLWSLKKIIYCIGVGGVAYFIFFIFKKTPRPEFPEVLRNIRVPYYIFLVFTIFWYILNLGNSAQVDGDLRFQMLGLRQFEEGITTQFNSLCIPISGIDLSKGKIEPIIWYPPAPMWIIYSLSKLGISLDRSAQLMALFSFLIGGCGFISVVRYLGISFNAQLVFSLVLVITTISRDGLNIIKPTSADVLAFAVFPWVSLFAFRAFKCIKSDIKFTHLLSIYSVLGFCVGSLYVIKYSWFVTSCSLAGFIGFAMIFIVSKYPFEKRVFLLGGFLCLFFIPFLLLNNHNKVVAGADALDYNEDASVGDNPYISAIYGDNFSSTTKPNQLPFSIFASPGFMLAGNVLATRVATFIKHIDGFHYFFNNYLKSNAYIWALIFSCLPFTFIAIKLLKEAFSFLDSMRKVYVIAMVLFPIALLGYLSITSKFNYLIESYYRYVIPYSLILQALLIHASIEAISNVCSRVWKYSCLISLFWVCVFPGASSVNRLVFDHSNSASGVHSFEVINGIVESNDDIVFFLNGYGPRQLGQFHREVQISFILNGGLSGGEPYYTTTPVRIIIAIESNLETNRSDIQKFLKRFPGVQWSITNAPESLYPNIFIGYMNPAEEIDSN